MHHWRYHVLTIIWIVVIAILTLSPARSVPDVPFWNIPYFDKIVHAGIFAPLAFLMARGLFKHYKPNAKAGNFFYITFIFSVLYGGLIEYLQNFIPGRSSEMLDLAANTIGVLIGLWIFYFFKSRKNNSV